MNKKINFKQYAAIFSMIAAGYMTPQLLLAQGASPPEAWQQQDVEIIPQHLTLEVASFPSRVIAASIAESLGDLGWSPVRLEESGDEFKVYFGYFSSPAQARFYQIAMSDQKIADPVIRSLKAAKADDYRKEDLFAPLKEPFRKKRGLDREWLKSADNQEKIQMFIASLAEEPATKFAANWKIINAEDIDELDKGRAIGEILIPLNKRKAYPELTYYLARQIASEEIPSTDDARILSRELVADLEYGHYRDWKAAWASSQALLRDPHRSAVGKVRDRMRLLALEIELDQLNDQGIQIHWDNVRSKLRQVFDTIPGSEKRLQAKVELVYLQTFAWEGDWDRVGEVAKNFFDRHESQVGEMALARIYYARSLERTASYDAAIAQIRLVRREYPTRTENLFLGMEPMDITALTNRWEDHFAEKKRQLRESKNEISAESEENEEISSN